MILIQLEKKTNCLASVLELFRSAYRKDHSTENALISVLDSPLGSADERLVFPVALLDPNLVFDTLNVAETA